MDYTGEGEVNSSGLRPKPRPTVGRKLETKVLPGTEDVDYSDDEESDDGRRGGRRMFPLLLEITKPCRKKGEREKLVRCIGSKGKCPMLVGDLRILC